MLFTVDINAEEAAIRASLQQALDFYSSRIRNVRRELVFVYHNNQYNPNHTNNLQQNEWQKKLNSFDKSHDNVDFAFSTISRYYYPNEIPLFRIRQLLMRLTPSHFHHILINPAPLAQSTDLLNNTSDVRRLARWVTHTSVGMVLSGGAARGWGHVGVVKAMNELGVPIDHVRRYQRGLAGGRGHRDLPRGLQPGEGDDAPCGADQLDARVLSDRYDAADPVAGGRRREG